MRSPYLWQDSAFPHFYHNPAVVEPLEEAFREEVGRLEGLLRTSAIGFDDVLTEEILANSEIEGVILDRESVHSSFVNNVVPSSEKESGAVALAKLALAHYREPLSHELLYQMHREILRGSNFPSESIGAYVGDMKVVSGTRLDREMQVIHEGVSKELVSEKMEEFISWYQQCSPDTPLVNAIQGHVHFETLHPFCDGNGRIGRNLILMGLCRDLGRSTPLALSRAFHSAQREYDQQFETGLDLTATIQQMSPLFLNAISETQKILLLTAFRAVISDQKAALNDRQWKVLNRLIDYELRGGFEGGLNNLKYQKMTGISDRTALRDLADLHERGLLSKTGQLKGTRYQLKLPRSLP